MKILITASECAPFIKVGGLADVVGTLPPYLKEDGHDVKIFIPKYQKIDENKFHLKKLAYKLQIPIGEKYEIAKVMTAVSPNGTDCYFIENDKYFGRPEVYGPSGEDYPDNRERFIFFSRSVLEASKAIGFQPDIVHCHDWQTGLIPAYLKTLYSIDGFYCNTATVFTIHNIAYQGLFKSDTINIAGFSWKDFVWDKLEYFGKINFLKIGLVYADMLSTVSPTYAKEILYEESGRGMEKTLRHRTNDLEGILNGIDYKEWNPSNDKLIVSNFSKDNREGKKKCKIDLQKVFNLKEKEGALLIGAVSRLDPQKGYNLIKKVLPKFVNNDVQFIFLGKGDKNIEKSLNNLARKYPSKIGVRFEFNNLLAHKIYAGSDAFIMPSLFEPCGLGQMIALAYGTIPIVNRTGGLFDTVKNFSEKTMEGNGFSFHPPEKENLLKTFKNVLKTYHNKKMWEKLIINALNSNFSWDKSARRYEEMYRKAVQKKKN
ncbi:MAG: glycogen synthase GlgA [Elusimicrobia bacterium]|nr:glycogen synthase GlgA [Elusimicrobiota bacterium]